MKIKMTLAALATATAFSGQAIAFDKCSHKADLAVIAYEATTAGLPVDKVKYVVGARYCQLTPQQCHDSADMAEFFFLSRGKDYNPEVAKSVWKSVKRDCDKNGLYGNQFSR